MITSMIFFPDPTFYEYPEHYDFNSEDVTMETPDGARLHAWYLHTDRPRGVILFFHGNAGNISHRLFKVKGWIERSYDVMLLDYRGYGKSEGKISNQKDVMTDAETAFHWVREHKKLPLSKMILYGESLGTHPAIRLASEFKVAAVILEAPYTSFTDLAATHYPMVPKMLMKDFHFGNIDYISKLKAPVFILHGTKDEICPYAMASTLFEEAPKPKDFFTIPDGTHNNLPMAAGEDYWEKPHEFVSKYLS